MAKLNNVTVNIEKIGNNFYVLNLFHVISIRIYSFVPIGTGLLTNHPPKCKLGS